MDIVLIRHTSVDVPPMTCYGQTDVPLRSTFPEEAEAVRKQLATLPPFDAVYVSPLSRCVRLATHCGYPDAVREPRVMEINFGEWEMKNYNDLHGPRLQAWFDDYIHTPAPGGESFAMQLQRVSVFIDELKQKPHKRVAVFTHGGVIVCAKLYNREITSDNLFSHVPDYGGIYSFTI